MGVFRRIWCIVVVAIGLSGAQSLADAEPVKLIMQLDLGVQNAQFAGLSWAQSHGWFADVGIELEVRRLPKGYGDLAANVAGSDHTIGSIESGLFLSGRAAGEPIVAIGTMFQSSPLGLAAKSHHGMRTPHDLVGMKVAVHGDGHEALTMVLAFAGVDADKVEVVEAEYGNGPLLRDEVDAKQVYYVDEYVKMNAEGHKVDALVYKDWGHAAYSQVIFVSEATLAKHRSALIAFLQVLDRGWRASEKYPRAAAALVVAEYEPQLALGYQQGSLKLILEDLIWAEDSRTGAIRPETWRTQADTLRATQLPNLPPMEDWTDFTLIEDAFASPLE